MTALDDHARLKAGAKAYLHALERANKHCAVDNDEARLAIMVWKVTIEGLEFVMKGEGVPASPSRAQASPGAGSRLRPDGFRPTNARGDDA